MAEASEFDEKRLTDAVQTVADAHNADVVLLNGPISELTVSKLHGLLEGLNNRRPAVFLTLVTYGGDAHAAYMIARDLHRHYERVMICVAGHCYSAGTLIVLSANELIIADRGRLGPLDAQILKKDEIGERLSGLTVGNALQELRKQALDTFLYFVQELKYNFGRQLSLPTAIQTASNMTSQLYAEVYKQVDPIRVGEDSMALRIAAHYGNILGNEAQNLKEEAVERLMTDYPSHECIIDRKEASGLFKNVREPNADEKALFAAIGPLATNAKVDVRETAVFIISDIFKQGDAHADTDASQQPGKKANGRRADDKRDDSRSPAPRGTAAGQDGSE